MVNLEEILGEPFLELGFDLPREEINDISNISRIEEETNIVTTPKKRKRDISFILDEETQIPFEIMREGIENTSDIVVKRTRGKLAKENDTSILSSEIPIPAQLVSEIEMIFSTPKQKQKEIVPERKTDEEEIEVLRREEAPLFNDYEIPMIEEPNLDQVFETPKKNKTTPKKKTPTPKKKKLQVFEIIQEMLKEEESVEFSKLDSFKRKETKVSFFYQILVLQTNGKIKVEQEEPFGEIIIEKGLQYGM